MVTHVRHGDVLLTRVDSLPTGKDVEHDGEYILAYGEVTGHRHRICVKEKSDMKVINANGVIFMQLAVDAPLVHEEHAEIIIPYGIWKVTTEREYDPFLESIRNVSD